MTLITFISKQIMPQALVAINCKPSNAILLHTDHPQESLIPAKNLKSLFVSKGWMKEDKVQLRMISHDQYSEIVRALEKIDLSQFENPVLNLTGGNKLMSLAGFFWASKYGIPVLYLERGNTLTRFEPDKATGTLKARDPIVIPDDLGREAEALDLLKTQLVNSEIATAGERLELLSQYHSESNQEFAQRILRDNQPEKYLSRSGKPHHRTQSGDLLEYRVAALLLKLNIQTVWRGVSLKNHKSGRLEHSEVDLIFQHGSAIWMVDCKDQVGAESLSDSLDLLFVKRNLILNNQEEKLIGRIRDQIQMKELKFLKEDLVLSRELGGLRGEVICVRKNKLTQEAENFANSNSIKVAYTDTLKEDLERILFPGRPASEDALKSLQDIFGA
jgi:hypothetical protein